ncbi:Retrovirus-related Pol polyprotein from transposon TNT 1-94 [Araneus ventricosus]|uniref:Retrovirus-related Pol polyprotein from transposon TNT 1-94 n=1 Tax=Araneus ventricosus TaxID=182803 RepID=A0A4Y2CKI2_ARAVE|nr:Retrovirus-related Pol polyprotein from transposon TNT 1-94 [Araneus ventricosus]
MRVVCPEVPAEVCVAFADQYLQLWHERLCHQNKTYVKESLVKGELRSVKANCPMRAAYVCGPMQERSIGESRYFVCFKDDFSRFRRVFMEFKSEVSNCLKVFLSEAKTAGHTIKEFLSDGGSSECKSCSVVNEPSVDHGSEIELIRSSDVPDSDVCQEIGEASCDAIDSRESPREQERNLRDRSMLKKPARYDNCVLLAEHAEPDTYKETIASKESSEWLAAMKEDMDSLEANNTWELVNLPQDRKAIGSRWVYKIKKNADGTFQRFKARIVAKGYSQKVGVDFNETFSPVVRWDTIRTVLSVAAYKKNRN